MSRQEPRATLVLDATISPSEDREKVISALREVVGESDSEVSFNGGSARLVTRDPRALMRLRDQFRDRHIRSVARKQLFSGSSGSGTTLILNRQAASAGVIALCGAPNESALGPIYVRIKADRLNEVIDWLSSYTEG